MILVSLLAREEEWGEGGAGLMQTEQQSILPTRLRYQSWAFEGQGISDNFNQKVVRPKVISKLRENLSYFFLVFISSWTNLGHRNTLGLSVAHPKTPKGKRNAFSLMDNLRNKPGCP